jgi:hypothetical protein
VSLRTSGTSILVTIENDYLSVHSYKGCLKLVKVGRRCLSVFVLRQTIFTLKVQLDAASYVADVVTCALKVPSKTWFLNAKLSYAWPVAFTVR